MALVLQITSGARAGTRVEFTKSIVTAGRHPDNDLRFDAQSDLDVSTRHAEIRSAENGWWIYDLGSTNGTWVNGKRITGPHQFRDGDMISFGAQGPKVEVVTTGLRADAPVPKTEMRKSAPGGGNTEQRVAAAVHKQTAPLKRFVIALSIIVVIGVAALVWLNQKATAQSKAMIAMLSAKNDSLIGATRGREAGLDSVAKDLKRQRDSLSRLLASSSTDQAALARAIEKLDRKQLGVMAASQVDWTRVSTANDKAIAFLYVKRKNNKMVSGTAFGITPEGMLVTNKHVVLDEADASPPALLIVQYANSERRVTARVEQVYDEFDLALIQIENPGPWPTVAGVAPSSSVGVGGAIGVIGFPLGNSLPMDSNGQFMIPRTTLTSGTLSKMLATEMQLDAFAAEGSSGSPVFDHRGFVVGVVNSGNTESGGRVVYAVPSTQLIANLPAKARAIVRQ